MTKTIVKSLILSSLLLFNIAHAKVFLTDQVIEDFAYSYDKCNDLSDKIKSDEHIQSYIAAFLATGGGLNALRVFFKTLFLNFGNDGKLSKFDMASLIPSAIVVIGGTAVYQDKKYKLPPNHPKMIANLIEDITIHRNGAKNSTYLTQMIEDMDTACLKNMLRDEYFCKTSFDKRNTIINLLIKESSDDQLCNDDIPNVNDLYRYLLTE